LPAALDSYANAAAAAAGADDAGDKVSTPAKKRRVSAKESFSDTDAVLSASTPADTKSSEEGLESLYKQLTDIQSKLEQLVTQRTVDVDSYDVSLKCYVKRLDYLTKSIEKIEITMS